MIENGWMIGLLLAYSGMLALSLGQERHFRQLCDCTLSRHLQQLLRGTGGVALVLSWLTCVQVWGGPIGTVAWGGLLSVGGLLLVALLAYAPRLAVGVAGLGWPLITALLLA